MIELIKTLCAPSGVAGDEAPAAAVAAELLKPLGTVHTTPLGSVICDIPCGDDTLPRVMLTAHLDRIGLIVTRITDKGFLKVSPAGSPTAGRWRVRGLRYTQIRPPARGRVHKSAPSFGRKPDPPFGGQGLGGRRMDAKMARELIVPGDRITLDGSLVELLGTASLPPRLTTAPAARR